MTLTVVILCAVPCGLVPSYLFKETYHPIARREPFTLMETDLVTMPLIIPQEGKIDKIGAPEGS